MMTRCRRCFSRARDVQAIGSLSTDTNTHSERVSLCVCPCCYCFVHRVQPCITFNPPQETSPQTKSTMAVSRLSIVKFLELALAITCVILHYKSLGERDDITKLLSAGTFVGYSVILIALFAGYMLSNPINKKLDLFFSLIGCAMFIASGVLILKEWENAWNTDTKKIGISKGSLAVTNGVLFFFDAIFTLRD